MSGARRLSAPAKLNLSLTVTGRRPDGFHELASLFVLLELADELNLVPGARGLTVEAPPGWGVPLLDEDNLAWRGLDLAVGRAGMDARLAVKKRIPVAAGLGGGSSDAAAAWRLGRAWLGIGDTPSASDIRELARLGADVPFFAEQAPAAWVTGIGEHVEPVTVSASTPREIVLALAGFALSTSAVFEALRPWDWSGAKARRPAAPTAVAAGYNDLLVAARRLRPELDDLARLIVAAGAEPHLTGSGPTMFVITDDPERADAVAIRLERAGVDTIRTRLRDEPASIERVAATREQEAS
jgi:4-diphosphocytidyl-2-C-methyl-D-erythritol kinase